MPASASEISSSRFLAADVSGGLVVPASDGGAGFAGTSDPAGVSGWPATDLMAASISLAMASGMPVSAPDPPVFGAEGSEEEGAGCPESDEAGTLESGSVIEVSEVESSRPDKRIPISETGTESEVTLVSEFRG